MEQSNQNPLIARVCAEKRHERALLLVTFGSTYEGPHKTFATLRNAFTESFPDRDIYMAFTSKNTIPQISGSKPLVKLAIRL